MPRATASDCSSHARQDSPTSVAHRRATRSWSARDRRHRRCTLPALSTPSAVVLVWSRHAGHRRRTRDGGRDGRAGPRRHVHRMVLSQRRQCLDRGGLPDWTHSSSGVGYVATPGIVCQTLPPYTTSNPFGTIVLADGSNNPNLVTDDMSLVAPPDRASAPPGCGGAAKRARPDRSPRSRCGPMGRRQRSRTGGTRASPARETPTPPAPQPTRSPSPAQRPDSAARPA